MDGQAGLVAKVCMLAGMTESEALYSFNQEICDNIPSCSCHKLHIINKRNGMTTILVGWADHDNGSRIYFALMPTLLWEHFRAITGFDDLDIRTSSKIVKKETMIRLSCICKIFYAVMKTSMDEKQLDAFFQTLIE